MSTFLSAVESATKVLQVLVDGVNSHDPVSMTIYAVVMVVGICGIFGYAGQSTLRNGRQ